MIKQIKRDHPGQPRKWKVITAMESARIIDRITQSFMPEKIPKCPTINKLINQ